MPSQTPATKFLDEHHIPYRIFEHDNQPTSLEEAARQRGQKPEQVIRSILFRLQGEGFVMVLMAGPGQLSWKRIRTHLGVSRLSLASGSDVAAITGYEIGTVNPFGIDQSVRVLADDSIIIPEIISFGSGARRVAIIITPVDLRKALPGIEFGKFSG